MATIERKWEERERTITATNEQWVKLTTYIHITTQYRKGEREAWEAMAKEVKPDGAPRFPRAADNARYFKELEEALGAIRKQIEGV